MLTPKYLEQLPDAILELYAQSEMDILANMARRISTYDYWIPAADWQAQKLVEAGIMRDDIVSIMSKMTGKSQAELRKLMQQAGSKTLTTDTEIYESNGLTVPTIRDSEVLTNVLNAGFKATNQTMKNLTKTTANTATKQFEDTLDRAWMQINSGAIDGNAAIRSAIKNLSRQGIGAITYPTGHIDNIEVAVRRAVVTGVNQTCGQLQITLADEVGCDLVETTAHGGARPSHAEWQGKIFSRSGKSKKYPDFRQSTGYGTGAGLCGWNCRHSFHPFFEGSSRAYTDDMLEDYEAKNYTYNGEKMTEYEATQQQREIERNIRRWKRENVAMESAGLDTTESAYKIKQWQDKQKNFLTQTGLKRQVDREQIPEFGKSEAGKAKHDAKVLQSMKDDAKIKAESGLPKKVAASGSMIQSTVDLEALKLNGVVPKGAELSNVYIMAGSDTCVQVHDWKRLYNQYGGDPSKWQKKTGVVITNNFKYEIHWYERNGIQIEAKPKGRKKL